MSHSYRQTRRAPLGGLALGWGGAPGAELAARGRRRREAQPELRELRRVDRRGCAGERVGAARGLGKGDHVADRVAAGGDRDDAVDAVGDAAVRRGAVAERLEEEAEALV